MAVRPGLPETFFAIAKKPRLKRHQAPSVLCGKMAEGIAWHDVETLRGWRRVYARVMATKCCASVTCAIYEARGDVKSARNKKFTLTFETCECQEVDLDSNRCS